MTTVGQKFLITRTENRDGLEAAFDQFRRTRFPQIPVKALQLEGHSPQLARKFCTKPFQFSAAP